MFQIRSSTLIRFSLALAFLFLSLSHPASQAGAQGTCGETYTVLPGDTLSEIAETCQTTVVAILELNPEISNPTDIIVGQVIRIPQSASMPVLAITPTCGFAGSLIQVMGSGFPSNANVEISMGASNQQPFIVEFVPSDDLGIIETQVYIPLYAIPYSSWIVIAELDTGSVRYLAKSNPFSVLGPLPNPSGASRYVVQTGDTFTSISTKFNRSVEEIFLANPQLNDPVQLSPGQTIQIPPAAAGAPVISISPFCGPPDTFLSVYGSNYSAGDTVDLRIGEYLTTYELANTAKVGTNQSFTSSLQVPPFAESGENWVVVGGSVQTPSESAISNAFAVTPRPDPNQASIYFIQPGDTLNAIAARFNRTVSAIQSANPQIPNPNALPSGQPLLIPGLQETVLLTPSSGPPGTRLQIVGGGFPPNSKVELSFGKRGAQYVIFETAITNTGGFFTSQISIPGSAQAGERWVVLAVQATANSPRTIAVSNDFVVSKPKPPTQSFVSIWPTNGLPETNLSVVASGFPPNTQISFSIGLAGSDPVPFLTTWTEINGTAAADALIPDDASPGETWTISAKTLGEPAISSTSEIFTVTDEGAQTYGDVNIFLVDVGGGDIGCGDAVLPVIRAIFPTQAPLTAAINELITNKARIDPESGLYNALYSSSLALGSIETTRDSVNIHLTGKLNFRDECDPQRALAQIEQTALLYTAGSEVYIFLNGDPFEEAANQE